MMLIYLILYRHGSVITLRDPRLCCHFMTENDKIKFFRIVKICLRPSYMLQTGATTEKYVRYDIICQPHSLQLSDDKQRETSEVPFNSAP